MSLFSRYGDPILDQIARDIFALFPNCRLCGRRIEQLENADVRVLVQCRAPRPLPRAGHGRHGARPA